ncbi:hypothetical protein CAI21_13880 [Alkalilimnicola ehrlichii]|uniref:Alpha-L-glutamate ligase-related protein ATP-grasp domain-containing protein n=1 Tax=Alkalilimnicola ehrlichii TaxID=351052 RepID=A0A3E0WR68_9GAMM|nr:hypothetical protein [Alkalilimnicola ehrlichii]RFA28000.1 hypothetical protein CAI21_13880 [Alkalilimnicola ehrlichii]RFA34651.1 hypothetical protein CAL65_14920 [Alkalilimnicola ehrlichii]
MSHEGRIERLNGITNLTHWRRFADRFFAVRPRPPRQLTAYLVERGFYPDKLDLYGLPNALADDYLSDLQVELLPYVNGRNRLVLENRNLFWQVFSGVLPLARPIALVTRRQVRVVDRLWEKVVEGGQENTRFILVALPLDDCQAQRSFQLEVKGGRVIAGGGEEAASDLRGFLAAQPVDLLLCLRAWSAPGYAKLAMGVDSRLKLLFLLNPKDNLPYLISAIYLLDGIGTTPAGGDGNEYVSARIDNDTGCIASIVRVEQVSRRQEVAAAFGDKGVLAVGDAIPGWLELVMQLQAGLRRLPLFGVIQLDVALAESGPMVVDAGARVSAAAFQVHGPIMGGDVQRRFLKEFGV